MLLLLLLPAGVSAQDEEVEVNPPALTYTSPNGGFSFTYPTEWEMLRDGYGSFTFVNDGYVLYKLENEFHRLFADEMLISVKVIPNAYAEEFYLMSGTTAAERLASHLEGLQESLEVSEIEALPNGLQRVTFTQADDFDGMLVVWDVGPDATGIGMLMTAPGNFAAFDEAAQELFLSFQLTTSLEAEIREYEASLQ